MLKLIVGTKGSGKTKTMIDMIDKATKTTSGNIVVIEKCMKLTTEINHAARLVDVDEYHDMAAAAKVLEAIDKITPNIEVVVTVSADAAELPEDLKKYVI